MGRPRSNEFSKKTKVEGFKLCGGKCQRCNKALHPGDIEFHHILEVALGGTGDISNLEVLCVACHAVVTATQSIPVVAKVKRVEANHIGATPASPRGMPGATKEQKEAARKARAGDRLPIPGPRLPVGFVSAGER